MKKDKGFRITLFIIILLIEIAIFLPMFINNQIPNFLNNEIIAFIFVIFNLFCFTFAIMD